METVNNVVNAASKTIFRDENDAEEEAAHNETGGQEPISGVKGAGNADEPFDRGNESTSATTTQPSTSGTADSTSANVDTTSASSRSDRTPFQKQQGADHPISTPSAKQTEIINTKTSAAERAQAGKPISEEEREQLAERGELPKDINDHSGEPMKMHDGSEDTSASAPSGSSAVKKDRSASVAHEGGGEHGKEKGTGEQWVKSTGMAADGGNFDATKPGAGREAARLLEEEKKGVKHGGDNHGSVQPDAPASTGEKEPHKESKLEKIKEKLHIGTGKHI